jgi:uncharacterized membrane protein
MARMKHNAILVITSLLSILFTTLHLTDDIVHGIAPGGLTNLPVVFFWVVWLYATLALAERRSGYVIILVASFLASGVSVVHMTGSSGITAGLGAESGAFFFAWTLLVLGVTSVVSVILSVRGLWSLRRGQPK